MAAGAAGTTVGLAATRDPALTGASLSMLLMSLRRLSGVLRGPNLGGEPLAYALFSQQEFPLRLW